MARVLLLLWRFAVHRWTRYVAAWLAVLGFAAYLHSVAVHVFDNKSSMPTEKRRHDGNDGHTSIDFGGQWIMGRMLVLGHGRHLYDRHYLELVARDSYPREDEA